MARYEQVVLKSTNRSDLVARHQDEIKKLEDAGNQVLGSDYNFVRGEYHLVIRYRSKSLKESLNE